MALEHVKQVIGRAVLDPEFRALLLNQPEQALQGYELTGQEQAALQQIAPEQFDQFIEQIQQQYGEIARWNFENAWPSKVTGPTPKDAAFEGDISAQKVNPQQLEQLGDLLVQSPGGAAAGGGDSAGVFWFFDADNLEVAGKKFAPAEFNSTKADYGDVDGDGDLIVMKVPGNLKWNDVVLKKGIDPTTSSDPEWKYIPVRRYFLHLERRILGGTKWAVFGIGLLLLLGCGVMAAIAIPNLIEARKGSNEYSETEEPALLLQTEPTDEVSTEEPGSGTVGGTGAGITGGGTGDQSRCGDNVCDPAVENSDLCPQDCHCADDGVCSPGEGAGCLDCGANAGSCGSPCSDSAQCAAGLACASGICWDACACGGDCGGDMGQTSGGGGACPCTRVCVSYDSAGNCTNFDYLDCNRQTCRP